MSRVVSETSEQWLLSWARNVISAHLQSGEPEPPGQLPADCTANLGCFVTPLLQQLWV